MNITCYFPVFFQQSANMQRMRFFSCRKDTVIIIKTTRILSFLNVGTFRMTLNITLNFKGMVGTGWGKTMMAASSYCVGWAGSSHWHHLSLLFLPSPQWQQLFFKAQSLMLFLLCGFPSYHCPFFILLYPFLFP